MADLADTVRRLACPLAEDAGLDLVDVVVKGGSARGGSRQRVQVVVDRKGGVDLGSCATLSRALARQLDDEDPVDSRYILEVTSPGTDWPLDDQRAFDRVEGRRVTAVLRVDEHRTEEVRGVVGRARPDIVELTADDGETHTVPYDRIVTATQELRW